MAVKFDSMQQVCKEEVEIPEGKVEEVCKQWVVHEDENLAYKLQNEEINTRLNHNKVRNQIVRSDLIQAKNIQQSENQFHQQLYQKMRKQKQTILDEQVAKELQLTLIEEEQRKIMEMQKILNEDEKLAKHLAQKEKQRAQRRKLAKELAQVEKIKHENLKIFLDNNINTIESLSDDLNEFDLSDFCIKPPEQLSGEQLSKFLTEQDEELAKFLQQYESQKKANFIKNKQQLIEDQDYKIAQILQEQEKAKLKQLKERRLQKQRLKQQKIDLNENQPEYYIPDDRLYRLPNSLNNEKKNFNLKHNQLFYDDSPSLKYEDYDYQVLKDDNNLVLTNVKNENFSLDDYNHGITGTIHSNSYLDSSNDYHENNKNLSFKYRNVSSNHLHPIPTFNSITKDTNYSNQDFKEENEKFYYNQDKSLNDNLINKDYAISSKKHQSISSQSNQSNHNQSSSNVCTFLNRALPPIPNSFHNIAMDIDPTYNRKIKQDFSNQNELTNCDKNLSTSNSNLNLIDSLDSNGVHFAQLARVSPCSFNESNLIKKTGHNYDNQDVFENQFIQQTNFANNIQSLNVSSYTPVQGQKRNMPGLNQKKSKPKEKNKEICRQQ